MHGVGLAMVVGALLGGCLNNANPESSDAEPSTPLGPTAGADAALVRPGYGIVGMGHGIAVGPVLTTGAACTTGFIVRSTINSTYYLATAGHCLNEFSPGQMIPVGFTGTHAEVSAPIAYVSHWADPTVNQDDCFELPDERRCFNDFGLILLNDAVLALTNPTLPTWGGPVAGSADVAVGSVVYTVGATSYRGSSPLPDARRGVTLASGEWRAMVQFTTTTPGGDSGSPVLDSSGRPLGFVIARAPNMVQEPLLGITYVGLLQPLLAAAAESGWPVEVVPGGPLTIL